MNTVVQSKLNVNKSIVNVKKSFNNVLLKLAEYSMNMVFYVKVQQLHQSTLHVYNKSNDNY